MRVFWKNTLPSKESRAEMSVSKANKPRWGIVSTVKANRRELGDFLAHHLELGADEIHIFLDNDAPRLLDTFSDTGRVFLHKTLDGFWDQIKGFRPKKHQTRQAWAANWLYHQNSNLDWLTHIDVDEFLYPATSISQALDGLSDDINIAQIYASEAMVQERKSTLDPTLTYAKAHNKIRAQDSTVFDTLFPTYWRYLRGGFLSHKEGKFFVRLGQPDFKIDLHAISQGSKWLKWDTALEGVDLVHFHTPSRARWKGRLNYRLEKGSYRPEIPNRGRVSDMSLSHHDFFTTLIKEGGEEALDHFFTEVCTARPELIEGLRAHGLLATYPLALTEKRLKYFPQLT